MSKMTLTFDAHLTLLTYLVKYNGHFLDQRLQSFLKENNNHFFPYKGLSV